MLTLAADLHDQEDTLVYSEGGETIAPFETRCRRWDGQIIEVSLSRSVVRDHNEAAVGISRIARDITDTRRTTEALQAIIDTASDVYMRVAADGTVTEWNHQAETLFGVDPRRSGRPRRRQHAFPGQSWRKPNRIVTL